MARQITQVEAVMRALARDLRPLEPYPGNNKDAWKLQHVTCGEVVVSSYNVIDQRMLSGCRKCSIILRSTKQREGNAKQAVAEMRSAGLEPLAPYPGTVKPWLCRHLACGEEVLTRHVNVRHNNVSGCMHCTKNCSADCGCSVRSGNAAPAALWAMKKMTPLVPFPGNSKPWLSQCQACGDETSPIYGNVYALHQKNPSNSACKHCSKKCAKTCACSVRAGKAA